MEIDFSSKNLIDWLERQDNVIYDQLLFGVVKMDKAGVVVYYNTAESLIAGVDPAMAIGKNFFIQIAPCTNNFMVAEKYNQEELDESLDYLFTYAITPTKVKLRLLKSATYNYQYLIVLKS